MASDEQFSKNLVLRVVQDEVQRRGALVQRLPEAPALSDEQEKLLEQTAKIIRLIGDRVDRDPQFNRLVGAFTRVADRQSFQKLVDKVFFDDITWGRIATLLCVVGKCIVKTLAELVLGIVSWTLDYFRDKLLRWIHNKGGWVNSISSLACYSLERDASSTSLISPSVGVVFISGLLLGGFIAWRVNRCA